MVTGGIFANRHPCDFGIRRCGEDLGGGTELSQLAIDQYPDPIGQITDVIQIVGYQEVGARRSATTSWNNSRNDWRRLISMAEKGSSSRARLGVAPRHRPTRRAVVVLREGLGPPIGGVLAVAGAQARAPPALPARITRQSVGVFAATLRCGKSA